MKFTFTSEEFAGTKTTVEFHADSLDDVLNNFKQFLQGSGFCLGINDVIEVNDTSSFYDFYNNNEGYPHYINDDEISIDDINLELSEPLEVYIDEPQKKKGKK